MKTVDQIMLRKILKKNGFKKSSTKDNRNLMEFTKGEIGSDDYLVVYTYDAVEFYYGEFVGNVIESIEKFKEIYEKYTLTKLIS